MRRAITRGLVQHEGTPTHPSCLCGVQNLRKVRQGFFFVRVLSFLARPSATCNDFVLINSRRGNHTEKLKKRERRRTNNPFKMSVIAFMYGFATAIVALVVAVLVGFSKVRLMTAEKLYSLEKSYELAQRPDAEAAAKLDPIKVASTVKLVRFDHNFMSGVPKNCRMVLLASTITVYELPADSSIAKSPGNSPAATKSASHLTQPGERLIGKIHVGSVIPIVHNNALAPNVKLSPAEQGMLGPMLVLKCRPDSATQLIFLPQSTSESSQPASPAASASSGAGGPDTAMSCTDDMPQLWTSIAIKFPTNRDLDRWTNVLSVTPETDAWRGFVKSLPSLDVFNLFVARLVFESNKSSSGGALNKLIQSKIDKKLRTVSKNLPKPLSGFITVQSVNCGNEIPLINDVSFVSYATNGELAFDFGLSYRGGFTVTLVATLSVRSVQVPQLVFIVRLVELKGKVHVSVGPPPSNKLWLGFHAPPVVTIDFKQEVASHDGVLSAVVALIPDLSDFISNLVKIQLFEDMVLPKMDDLPLPNVEKDDDDDDDTPTIRSQDVMSSQGLGTPQSIGNEGDGVGVGRTSAAVPHMTDCDSFVMVDRHSTPPPHHPSSGDGANVERRKLLASRHSRTGSGGSDMGASGRLRSPLRAGSTRGPSPPPPSQPHGSHVVSPSDPLGTSPGGNAAAHHIGGLPDAVRLKSDNVKAVLAQKAAELRRVAMKTTPAPLEGTASPITPAASSTTEKFVAGGEAPVSKPFMQPQWSTAKW